MSASTEPATTEPATATGQPPLWFPLRWQLESTAWTGLHGESPLRWWSGGWYAGELRELVLQQRRQPRAAGLAAPLEALLQQLVEAPLGPSQVQRWQELLLVPIPSGRHQPNPVPAVLSTLLVETLNRRGQALLPCRQQPELLLRRRRVAAQRRLKRQQRWRNQWLSFCSLMPANQAQAQRAGVLLVDDVLTSGATAMAAQLALQSAGWTVAGLLCLARTPRIR